MAHKRTAVIVDMDGTLAIITGRHAYSARVESDEPNAPVIEVAVALAERGHEIIIVSGREEKARKATEAWLDQHLPVKVLGLYMRPARDGRPDHVVKTEIYREKIKPRFDIVCVLDDRDSVVRMWRGLGLTCLQVAPGRF